MRELHINLHTKTGIVQFPIRFPDLMYISPPLSIVKTHLHSLYSAMCALYLTHILWQVCACQMRYLHII